MSARARKDVLSSEKYINCEDSAYEDLIFQAVEIFIREKGGWQCPETR